MQAAELPDRFPLAVSATTPPGGYRAQPPFYTAPRGLNRVCTTTYTESPAVLPRLETRSPGTEMWANSQGLILSGQSQGPGFRKPDPRASSLDHTQEPPCGADSCELTALDATGNGRSGPCSSQHLVPNLGLHPHQGRLGRPNHGYTKPG